MVVTIVLQLLFFPQHFVNPAAAVVLTVGGNTIPGRCTVCRNRLQAELQLLKSLFSKKTSVLQVLLYGVLFK